MISTIVRILLSVVLLYFVYGETGVATTIAMTLMILSVELISLIMRRILDKIS